MSLLAPAALALLSLAVPLVVLYMLRSRRQMVEVPSVRLWMGEEEHVSSALPWQRLRVTAALILQLLALVAFALLLARPFLEERTLLGPHTVMIIDTSGSMGYEGRFEAAVAEARRLAADASEARLLSVIDAGPRPRVLAAFSRDAETALAAVDRLEVGGGSEDLEAALRLARALATPDRPTSILLMTDGGIPGAVAEPVSSARQIPFGAVGDNVAITGFGTGVPGEGGSRVFVEITNFSNRIFDVAAEISVDGLAVGTSTITLNPQQKASEIVPVDAGPGQVVQVRLVDHSDANSLDDSSSLVLSGAASLSVTVLGEGSPFLDALVSALPGTGAPVGTPPDVVIVDGGDATTIDRPAWLIAPEVPPPGVAVLGRVENPIVSFQRPAEPILDGLDLGELVVAEADIVEAPGWLPLVSAADVPLILLGDVGGHRAVYFTFDVVRSNLPVDVSFPILGARIIDHLGGNRLSTAGTAVAGAPIPLVPPARGSSVITTPSGDVVTLPAEVGEFTDTSAPGIYRLSYVAEDGSVVGGDIAARQFAASEAAGAARSISTDFSEGAVTEEAPVLREWAPLILVVLLAVVLLEWWVAFGRPLPGRRGEVAA